MPRLETLRAKAGAAMLDILQPGWAHRINLSKLDLADCDVCVLGQLYGEYEKGASQLFAMQAEGDRQQTAARGGFISWARDMDCVEYPRLTAAWRRQIEKRQAA